MTLFNKDLPDNYEGEGIEHLARLIRRQLWVQILIALVLGVALGSWLSPEGGRAVAADTAYAIAEWIKLPGTIFLNMIQMVVIPLVISSIMLGVGGNGDSDNLKSIGLKIAPYFVLTTTLAVSIGISLALMIQPGDYVDVEALMANAATTSTPANTSTTATVASTPGSIAPVSDVSLPQRLSALIPTNITRAIYEQSMLNW